MSCDATETKCPGELGRKKDADRLLILSCCIKVRDGGQIIHSVAVVVVATVVKSRSFMQWEN